MPITYPHNYLIHTHNPQTSGSAPLVQNATGYHLDNIKQVLSGKVWCNRANLAEVEWKRWRKMSSVRVHQSDGGGDLSLYPKQQYGLINGESSGGKLFSQEPRGFPCSRGKKKERTVHDFHFHALQIASINVLLFFIKRSLDEVIVDGCYYI